jgi:hypothetical protein
MSRPDLHQGFASSWAGQVHRSETERGHFMPWALLEFDGFTRAYRFVYPTLLVSAFDRAFLWHIPSAELSQTILDLQTLADGHPLGDINYVELSERYVFICGSNQLRIFSRSTGKMVWHIPHSRTIGGSWLMHVDLRAQSILPALDDAVFVPQIASFSHIKERGSSHHLSNEFVGGNYESTSV